MFTIQSLLDHSTIPVITAFLLGILTAVSPCLLATNITAIGYISKDIENRHRIFYNGLLYTVGRILTYTLLGFILIPILREGASIFSIQKVISTYGELFIAPFMLLTGLFMLFSHKLNLPQFGFSQAKGDQLKGKGLWGALLLGIIFSLAFCPTSGVFYFGMLMPLSAVESEGYLLPFVFAVATGLPVLVVSWILAFSVAGIGKFYNRMRLFQQWFSKIVAWLFIAVGLYYIYLFYIN